ncbi:hypothetical protein Tco_0827359 [Tanacetum coccineum]
MFFRETIEGAQGYKVKDAKKAILESILKKHDGPGMFFRETIEGAHGYKVKDVKKAILEAILKKYDGLEATCLFSDAALRTSLLYVV